MAELTKRERAVLDAAYAYKATYEEWRKAVTDETEDEPQLRRAQGRAFVTFRQSALRLGKVRKFDEEAAK